MPPPIPDNVCAANLKGASDVAVANFIAEYDACQTAECRALAIQHWHDALDAAISLYEECKAGGGQDQP